MLTFLVFAASAMLFVSNRQLRGERLYNAAEAATTAAVKLPFRYTFSVDGRLDESSQLLNSTSPYWWLTSGAYFYLKGGVGSTIKGSLPPTNKWYLLYQKNDPGETDNGEHPQNIFRLFTRTAWQNVAQEVSYRITDYHLSTDEHRAGSNGLLLFNRFKNSDNTYYAGLRVDGYAVIKKKINGVYYTMAYSPVINGRKYDRATNPNLLPMNTWIRLKTEVSNVTANTVSIKFYADIGNTGTWAKVAEAVDNGKTYGGAALVEPGLGGMRTDFMDVDFDNYGLTAISGI